MDPLQVLMLLLQVVLLGLVGLVVLFCIRVRAHFMIARRSFERVSKMDLKELLDSIPDIDGPHRAEAEPTQRNAEAPAVISMKRARVAAEIAGGHRLVLKGKPVTPEMVETMPDSDVEDLCARVEARIGAAMSKSLGSSLLHLYTSAASTLLPIPATEQKILTKELEEDPLVRDWLQATCCQLYYRYGMFLAPLSAAIITAKHCDWRRPSPPNEEDAYHAEAYTGDSSMLASGEHTSPAN
jgi:hypothetical protein